jgi:RHS repeat-associated protein
VGELNGNTDIFGYDALYRLTSEQRTGSNPLAHSYGYDLAGNRTNVDGAGFTFDNANKPTGTYITNDLDGNLLTGGTYGYLHLSWDPYNRMLSQYYQNGANLVGRYEYDGLGHRFADWPYVSGNQKRLFYVFDGDLLLGEVQADQFGNTNPYPITANTWGAPGLVSERLVSQNKSLWYAFGPQGETRQLTDSVGNIVDTYIYTAYGAPVASTGTDYNPHRFGGQFGYYTDPYASQDVILCGARWYDASLGRWMSRDPIGYAGGANLYEYCTSDPVNQIDPGGLEGITTLRAPSGH